MEDEHRDPPRRGALRVGAEARVGLQRLLPDALAPLVLDLFRAERPALALDLDLAAGVLAQEPMIVSPSGVGIASSGTVRRSPLRAPVVVTIATGSAPSRLETMCLPRVARNAARSRWSSTRENTHDPGPLAANRRMLRCHVLASAKSRDMLGTLPRREE